jgi:Uri superfamily endonuclease
MLEIICLTGSPRYPSSGREADLALDRIKERISSGPGTYVLILFVARAKSLTIGSLGTYPFPRGYYGYIGSAFGPGGLRARLAHHLKASSKPHWHIDYLRRQTDSIEIGFRSAPIKQEHAWARLCQSMPGVSIAAPRFGASDCACASHLFFFSSPVRATLFKSLDSIGPYVTEET